MARSLANHLSGQLPSRQTIGRSCCWRIGHTPRRNDHRGNRSGPGSRRSHCRGTGLLRGPVYDMQLMGYRNCDCLHSLPQYLDLRAPAMRRRPILYVTTAGTVIFNLLAIILGLGGAIIAFRRQPAGTWVLLSNVAFSFGIAFLCFHIFLRRSQRNGDSSRRGRKR